jgi:hypothetical protein
MSGSLARFVRFGALAALAFAAASAAVAEPIAAPRNPNDFFASGPPTFVIGTAGDDRADQGIAAQAGVIRDLLFPKAPVVKDVEVDASKGRAGWPERPIVYGGPHVNALLARVEPSLPFRLAAGRLEIGGSTFEGTEYRLIALVPEAAEHPAFLLYAGTGTPGVAEINGIQHGAQGVLVADRFGPLVTGEWSRDEKGAATVALGTRSQRIEWRTARRGDVDVHRPGMIPVAAEAEAAQDAAILRGVARSVAALKVEAREGIGFYVYPDARSKASLTSSSADGHADCASRTLHVRVADASPGGPLENLIAHEATHVIAYDVWGAAGTPFLAEGLAVWASGKYQGVALADWRPRLPATLPTLAQLLGPTFRSTPEPVTYPVAGLFVGAVVEAVGLSAFRDHVYAATSRTWADAAKAAGTTSEALDQRYLAALGR